MEQKNTIIALILIFIVWLIFSTWFAPEPSKVSTKSQTETENITKNDGVSKNPKNVETDLSVNINRKKEMIKSNFCIISNLVILI